MYEAIIGLEVHVQIKTETKMFCGCPNQYGEEANTLICPVCMGYPGVLPVPNSKAIQMTWIAGLLCDCTLAPYSRFDRKSYFYPDMPKNYQITQYELPFCEHGKLEVTGKGLTGEWLSPREIGIDRIHLEEDVGKSIHYKHCSGIDFNRAGVPLMEIVTTPSMRSPDEAYCFLTTLKQVIQYGKISDCDMEKGQMRCDVNISVRNAGATNYNSKTELKNLNSFRSVYRGLVFEIDRQQSILDRQGILSQQTRGWDDDNGISYPLRKKESDQDYRYFPEPDLTPILLSEEKIKALEEKLPETPVKRRKRLIKEYQLPEYDAFLLTSDASYADFFEDCVAAGGNPKLASNWIMTEILREITQTNIPLSQCSITPIHLASLLTLIEQKVINGKIAKTVFEEMMQTGDAPRDIVKKRGLTQVTDTEEILVFVQETIQRNPKVVAQFQGGKENAIHFLVGQVMKLSKGKANPALVRELLIKECHTSKSNA